MTVACFRRNDFRIAAEYSRGLFHFIWGSRHHGVFFEAEFSGFEGDE